MKKFFSGLLKGSGSTKAERFLIVLIPLLTLLLIISIIGPTVIYFSASAPIESDDVVSDEAEPLPAAPSTSPSPVSSVPAAGSAAAGAAARSAVSPSPSPAALTETFVTAFSAERDMYVSVKNAFGDLIRNEEFVISVSYPNGEQYYYKTETDGTCYLSGLSAGEYTVSAGSHGSYAASAPVTCSVRASWAGRVARVSSISAMSATSAMEEISRQLW